jgi:hypothetical protein
VTRRSLTTPSLLALSAIASACGPLTEAPAPETGELAETRSTLVALATPRAAEELTGEASDSSPTSSSKAPWPVAVLSIGHTIASYQSYGTGPYFHHGLDIRADAGSPVRASAGGKVVNLENYVPGSPAYWEVAVQDDQGFVWQYHHVDEGSIPEAVREAYRTGGRVEAGALLGEVYFWEVETFGERYHHVHLNVLAPGGAYRNPFDFLTPLADDKAPVFVEVGLHRGGQKLTSGAPVAGGEGYGLYAKVHDLVLHDLFVVPPRIITYSVDGAAPRTVWEFGSLPGGASKTAFVRDYFVESMTCGDYGCRELTVDLGFGLESPAALPRGQGAHKVDITARDDAGNTTSTTFEWTVE